MQFLGCWLWLFLLRYIHDNYASGIYVEAGNAGEILIQIQGARSNNNGSGMRFNIGSYVTLKLKDSETSNNDVDGIDISTSGGSGPAKVDLEGSIISRYNRDGGMHFTTCRRGCSGDTLDVTVKGVLNSYKNGEHGLLIGRRVNVVVEKGGYLNSCKTTLKKMAMSTFTSMMELLVGWIHTLVVLKDLMVLPVCQTVMIALLAKMNRASSCQEPASIICICVKKKFKDE